MADEGFKRKLAAILSADVEGYSRLMDDDEEATVRTLTSYRIAISDLVQQFRGRIVDAPGDNILAEFTSVVDAVNCAVEIQRDLAERNTELPYNRQMQFRIGVNLGDVIEEDGRIYGDGINIAARVESLSEAGGICISGRAYDQVANKLGLEYENLGEHQVKNISVPIRIYRVLSHPGAAAHRVVQAKETLGRKWRKIAISSAVVVLIVGGLAFWQFYMRRPAIEPASVDKMAFPLPEKPSIAVLPFANMSKDPKQEYLSDGITEQIISTLSKVPSMFVIARTSTFAYKDKPVKVQQVSEELGVRYVLEGSVQRSEDKVRITAQLIDAIDGKHMWAQRYDRELRDIFELQDEITLEIIKALQVKLTEGEQANIWTKKWPNNVEYVEKLFEARFYLSEWNKESNIKAKQLFKEAIDLEPEHHSGYSGLAMALLADVWLGSSSSPRETLGQAFKLCKKALSLDEKQDVPHAVIGNIYLLNRKYDLAIKEAKRAIALNPNSAVGYVWLGQNLSFSGRHEEAIESIKKGLRLKPIPDDYYILVLAFAYREAGRYEEALTEYRRVLKLRSNNVLAHLGSSITYALAGRVEEAREAYSEVLKIYPEYSFEKSLKTYPFRPERLVVIKAAMQKAGLPFKPPLPLPDKPSIAVLAFDNLSGDPEQEYLSDGIAENIITALSKVGELFVIARNSSFTYKGQPVKVQQVSRELGVRYVLEGGVQKSGDRVRITAQLIDAKSGQHVWAEKYDRDLKDIFKIQDEITLKIVNGLQIQLTEGEHARIWSKQNCSLDAYLKAAEAQSIRHKGTKESFIRYGQIGQEIVEAEPECLMGYSILVWYNAAIEPYTKSPKKFIEKAFKYAQKGLSIDDSDPSTLRNAGLVYLHKREYEKAIDMGQRAVNMAPNGAEFHAMLGFILSYAEMPDKGIVHANQAIRLDPFPQVWPHATLGRCYLLKGQYDKSLEAYRKALKISPDNTLALGGIIAAYSLLGREEDAHREAKRLLELMPGLNVAFLNGSPFKNQEDRNRFIDAWLKAGIPDKRQTAQQNEDN